MNTLTKIKPVPQSASLTGGNVRLGSLGHADLHIRTSNLFGKLAQSALKYLYSSLSGVLDTCAESADGKLEILLKLSGDVPAAVKKNSDQAYSLEVTQEKITLTGYGEAGLYFAVTTLLQCIEVENNIVSIPAMQVLDWPDLRTRGHFMECRFGSNLMTLDDWKGVVDDMASMKLNQLVVALYGCWCVQYDGIISEYAYVPVPKYPLIKSDVIKRYYSPKAGRWINETVPVPMASEDFFGELVSYGRSRGVEVLPLWNSYGHNTLIPRMYPNVSARSNGKPTGHGYCVSNPETYELLCSVFDHIIDAYLAPNGITSFHIGMDEVRDEIATDLDDFFKVTSPWCDCPACSKLTNEEKFISHAIKLIRHLKNRGMKSVYIYSDMMTKIIDPAKFKALLIENDLLDVTVIDWWTYENDKTHLMFQSLRPDLGIRATVKPWNSYYHWNISTNSVPNVYNLAELANRDGAEGLQSYAAWDKVCDKNHVSMADYSWNFAGTGSAAEFTDRYTAREFGARYDDARRAIALMDQLTEDANSNPISPDDTVANGSILQSTLAYYFYSYVRPGKPYPRNYPGEGLTRILENRPVFEHHLRQIADLARQAVALFDSLAADTRCNTDLARRFSCEANNYLALSEDFLALLQIHDILAKPERSSIVSETIRTLAASRKENRKSLMLKMELTKEPFLIPSHLRNQSIYMQTFADIEAYVSAADPASLELNVEDLRAIGSKAFYQLR